MISRHAQKEVEERLKHFRVVGLLGPRQCGKTTLARQISAEHFLDLENPVDLAKLDEPKLCLEPLRGTIVIDEIQRKPDLFPLLRHLVDYRSDQRYLILGSASRDLIRQSSESLAGRISYVSLHGFDLEEVGMDHLTKLWIRGGFPRSFLASDDRVSFQWRRDFIRDFLERDIPQLGISIPSETLRRFWMMLSHYHGQILNVSEIGRSFGVSDMTARKYIDILAGTFMVRLLQPWFTNVGKRVVKQPRLYFQDSGIFHTLQNIENFEELTAHPKLGASWEGFALEMAIRCLRLSSDECFFWKTHGGSEVDLFWKAKGKLWGIEVKYSDAPRRTRSMLSAI
ncbi:MAG: hypothetical protein A3I05_04755, partial [Deltaproteobacteria bacterium RIFCSPLOWO2_02_FULL_44_10]